MENIKQHKTTRRKGIALDIAVTPDPLQEDDTWVGMWSLTLKTTEDTIWKHNYITYTNALKNISEKTLVVYRKLPNIWKGGTEEINKLLEQLHIQKRDQSQVIRHPLSVDQSKIESCWLTPT